MADRLHLRRPCDRCDNIFRPEGKYQRICDDCSNFSESNKNFKIWIEKGKFFLNGRNFHDKRYFKIKEELKELNKLIRVALK